MKEFIISYGLCIGILMMGVGLIIQIIQACDLGRTTSRIKEEARRIKEEARKFIISDAQLKFTPFSEEDIRKAAEKAGCSVQDVKDELAGKHSADENTEIRAEYAAMIVKMEALKKSFQN
jgi:Na+-translocating ferredoxin:NAD+ oxidoreductase RnfG subunit